MLDVAKRYSTSEILKALGESKLPSAIKEHIDATISGQLQFIFNLLATPNFDETPLSMVISSPDLWETGYNHMAQIYQNAKKAN